MQPDAVLTNTRSAAGQTSLLAIAQLHDIEEDIWSPTYGLKGKVDASVQAIIVDQAEDTARATPVLIASGVACRGACGAAGRPGGLPAIWARTSRTTAKSMRLSASLVANGELGPPRT